MQAQNIDDKSFEKMSVLIQSMTEAERKDPKLIDTSVLEEESV
jgi:signal recognition particle subunit SRP54